MLFRSSRLRCVRLVRCEWVHHTEETAPFDAGVLLAALPEGSSIITIRTANAKPEVVLPVTPFERSGLAYGYGFGHRRFACAILQAKWIIGTIPSCTSLSNRRCQCNPSVFKCVQFKSHRDSPRWGSFKRRYRKRPGAEHFCRQRASLRRGASDTTLTSIVHNLGLSRNTNCFLIK